MGPHPVGPPPPHPALPSLPSPGDMMGPHPVGPPTPSSPLSLSLLRGRDGSHPVGAGRPAASAHRLRRTEHGAVRAQHLRDAVSDEHGPAEGRRPRQGARLPQDRYAPLPSPLPPLPHGPAEGRRPREGARLPQDRYAPLPSLLPPPPWTS